MSWINWNIILDSKNNVPVFVLPVNFNEIFLYPFWRITLKTVHVKIIT